MTRRRALRQRRGELAAVTLLVGTPVLLRRMRRDLLDEQRLVKAIGEPGSKLAGTSWVAQRVAIEGCEGFTDDVA